MTTARVRASQAARPPRPGRMIRVTIQAASPLTVVLPGGAIVPGVKLQGMTYVAGAAAWAYYEEPAVGPVFPTA